jgi:RND family efflux transporter MFP subunit
MSEADDPSTPRDGGIDRAVSPDNGRPTPAGTARAADGDVRPAEPEGKPGGADDLGFDLPEPAKVSRSRALAIGAVVLVLGAGAFAFGWLPKHRAKGQLETESRAAAGAAIRVQVVRPKIGASDRAVGLPGTIQPEEETVIYARASGYVAKWDADIGDKVKEGQLLVEIETPELDQQLLQARAELAQADAGLLQSRANADFSRVTLQRSEQLLQNGLASGQDHDKAKAQAAVDQANIAVAEANIAAHRAEIQRLMQLKGFAKVKAPFAGSIIARNVERGALVTAGTGNPLFRLAATDVVRVVVQVPQNVAPGVKTEMTARVTVREFPARTFEGRVSQAAGALDPATRTMTTVVRVPNPERTLLAGMYAEVAFTLPTPHEIVELPAAALLNDARGLRVAVVGPDNRIRVVPVTVERDTGATIELASGLEGNERVVALASPDLVDGLEVDAVEVPAAAAASGSAAAGPAPPPAGSAADRPRGAESPPAPPPPRAPTR